MNTKEKIKKLRQDAEWKIQEANDLEASLPNTEQDKVVKQLNKRFQKLEDGFQIEWHPKSRFKVPTITSAVWFSYNEPDFDQDIDERFEEALEDYRYALHGEWEAWIEDHPQVIQMRRDIKELTNESDRQAKKFVVNKVDFWEMVMDGAQ